MPRAYLSGPPPSLHLMEQQYQTIFAIEQIFYKLNASLNHDTFIIWHFRASMGTRDGEVVNPCPF